MVQGQCVPYTFADEFQRIRECLAELGCTPSDGSTTGVPIDIRTSGRVDISGDSFQTVLEWCIPDNQKFQLKHFYVSLLGFSGEVVVDYTRDKINYELIRSYILNVQSPNFEENLAGCITKFPKISDEYSCFRIRAKMNGGACTNLEGTVFAAINGFLLPYP